MKKIFYIFIFILIFGSFVPSVDAVQPNVDSMVDKFLPASASPTYQRGEGPVQQGDMLPTADLKTQILPQAIKVLLMLVGSISFIVFVYAGVMLVIAQGNEEEVTKFKNVIIWSLVGLVFITLSYGLVTGIMRLSFS